MKSATKVRVSKRRVQSRSTNVQEQMNNALVRIRARAEKILGATTRPRTFEQIYEELAHLETKDSILLRNAIAKIYSA